MFPFVWFGVFVIFILFKFFVWFVFAHNCSSFMYALVTYLFVFSWDIWCICLFLMFSSVFIFYVCVLCVLFQCLFLYVYTLNACVFMFIFECFVFKSLNFVMNVLGTTNKPFSVLLIKFMCKMKHRPMFCTCTAVGCGVTTVFHLYINCL